MGHNWSDIKNTVFYHMEGNKCSTEVDKQKRNTYWIIKVISIAPETLKHNNSICIVLRHKQGGNKP